MAPYQNFVWGSYPSQSPLADAERMGCWYPELMESPGGRGQYNAYPTPGQRPYIANPQITDVGTRALFAMRGRAFGVVGTGVYELFQTQTATRNATSVTQNNFQAQIASNGIAGNQLLVSSGTNAYSLNLTTMALTQVLTGESTMVGMIDGYFVAFNLLNSRYRISDLNDGLTWDPTQFLARSIAPDPWQAMTIRSREIVLIGEYTGEVHYNTGGFPFPFAPIPGAIFQYGIAAPFSIGVAGERVLWLAKSANGAGQVVEMPGYTPQRVSTHAVETAIATYARTSSIADAEAFVYEDQGHTFYVLSFPSAQATWVYDLSTKIWHERWRWNVATGQPEIWSPRVHCHAFGKHLVGNRSSSTIADMDVTYGSEVDGGPIRRVRVGPALWVKDNRNRLRVSYFEPQFQRGTGLVSGQGSHPIAMLRVSKDGRTFGPERHATLGAMGEYSHRAYFNRCGSSDYVWMPELSVTDPSPMRLLGANIDGDGLTSAKAA